MQGYPTTPDPWQTPQQTPPPAPFGSPVAPPFAPPSPAPGAPNPPQSNRKKLLIGGGIGCGVLLVLCMCVGLLSAILSNGSTTANQSGSPTVTQRQNNGQTQAPTATTRPTATPDPNAGASAYEAVVTADGTTMGADLSAVADACGSGDDLSACRAALVVVREDSQNFLADLDAHPTPPCLKSADKPLRAALTHIHTAAQEVIDGIDDYDVAKVKDGTALMNKATTEINTASGEFDKASCS